MRAFCYASGHIGFGEDLPSGALPLARGDRDAVIAHVSGLARRSHHGSELFVPGIPEATNDDERLGAMQAFIRDLTLNIPDGVETLYSHAARLRGLGGPIMTPRGP